MIHVVKFIFARVKWRMKQWKWNLISWLSVNVLCLSVNMDAVYTHRLLVMNSLCTHNISSHLHLLSDGPSHSQLNFQYKSEWWEITEIFQIALKLDVCNAHSISLFTFMIRMHGCMNVNAHACIYIYTIYM